MLICCVILSTGLNIGTSNKGQKRALNREVCQVPGFTIVQWLLPKHANVAEIYFILMAMLMGQHIKDLPSDVQVNIPCDRTLHTYRHALLISQCERV